MDRKRVLLSLTTLLLTLIFVGVFIIARTSNAAPLSQKTHAVNTTDANEDQVYISTTSTSITALNSSTGATLWTLQLGHYIDPPTTVNHIVYALVLAIPFSTLYALDLNKGSTLWTFRQNGSVNPPVFNNAVYITVDSATAPYSTTLYKLNATTGATIWTFQPGVQLSSTALISKGVAYITSENAGPIYALQASNGKKLWQSQPTTDPQLSAREVVGGVLYVDGQGPQYSFGMLYAYSITDGTLLWSTDAGLWTVVNKITYIKGGTIDNPEICALDSEAGTPLWCTPGNVITVADGLAYVTTDTGLTVFNARNGMQVWSAHQNQFVTLNQGVVYTVNANNAIEARKATNGAVLWDSSVTNGFSTVFLIADGKIYASSANNTVLYSLDATNGALRWSLPLSSALPCPTIAHGILFVLTSDNRVYALQASNGKLLWQH